MNLWRSLRQQLILRIVDNVSRLYCIEFILDNCCYHIAIYSECKSTICTHLSCAYCHTFEGKYILIWEPRKPRSISVECWSWITLDVDCALLVWLKTNLVTICRLKRMSILLAIGIDTQETNHWRNFTIGVDEHLLGMKQGLHTSTSKSDK